MPSVRRQRPAVRLPRRTSAAARRFRRVVLVCCGGPGVSPLLPFVEISTVHEPLWFGGWIFPVALSVVAAGGAWSAWARPHAVKRTAVAVGVAALVVDVAAVAAAGGAYVTHAADRLYAGMALVSLWPLAGAWIVGAVAVVLLAGGAANWAPTVTLLAEQPSADGADDPNG